jgi:hypothetical protein
VSAADPHHATHRTIDAIWRIESAHVIAGPSTHNLSFFLFVRKFTTRQRYVASRLPPCVNCCEQAIALIDPRRGGWGVVGAMAIFRQLASLATIGEGCL